MEYRVLSTEAEYESANALLKSDPYYPDDVRLQELGGIVLGALTPDEEVVGSVWLGITGLRAYVDYAVTNNAHKGVAVRLLAKARNLMKLAGVKEIRFDIYNFDKEATKVALAFGAELSAPYTHGYVKLGDPDVPEEK